MTATAKVFNGMLRVASVLGTVCVAVLILYANEKPWLVYQNLPFPVLTPKIKPGEAVELVVERCNTSDEFQRYTTTHSLREVGTNTQTILPDVSVDLEQGCKRGISKINITPTSTADGKYVAYGLAVVPGFWRTFYAPWYSEEFEVKAP